MNKTLIGICVGILILGTLVPAGESLNETPLTSTWGNQHFSRENWTETQKLLPSDGAQWDRFGWPVCIVGDTAIIGARYDDDNGIDSGATYVFTRTGTTWTQQAKLVASDGHSEDWFGHSLSLSGDTALIAAWKDTDQGFNSGSAYIFTRSGSTWTQQQKLLASDGTANDGFGCTVSLFGDTAIIGAWGDDDLGAGSGSAYVFTRTGTSWTQQQKLLASDGSAFDAFGSVSLHDNTVLIGANGDDNLRGSAYVFTRTGTTWAQQAKLLAGDGTAEDYLGLHVALDSDTALIGAYRHDSNKTDSGSAYVFTRTGTTWTQQAKLLASDAAAEDYFGYYIALDGDVALLGAPSDDDHGEASGSAYLFTRTGTTWTQQQKLLASDGAAIDCFGISVSLSGTTAVIGAYCNDDNGNDSGSAYIFTKSENQPPDAPTITGPTQGKVKVPTTYNFTTTDPDDDEVFYYIDWGDETNSGWLGPYHSGDTMTQAHTWLTKDTYVITAKAKDIHGNESEWSTLTVTMPLFSNIPSLSFWERLFERFPSFFLILGYLLHH